MPFGLKNARATYQRAMTALFHDLMHQEVEVYVDDMIAIDTPFWHSLHVSLVYCIRSFLEALCLIQDVLLGPNAFSPVQNVIPI